MFMSSVYGKILKAKKEYKVAQHVDKQVINDISDWILSKKKDSYYHNERWSIHDRAKEC
jgi:hypothetical protein